MVKIDREKELLKEVKDRIRFQAEKHAAEMELLKTKINNK